MAMVFTPSWHLKKTSSGFTLMELIIAMTIVAILAGALLANFFTSLSKGRDSRRKQDLENYAKALEIYYNDHKAYPVMNESPGNPLTDGTTIYMQELPKDPKHDNNPQWIYDYDAIGTPPGSSYAIYACLENGNDPDRKIGGYAGSSGVCANSGAAYTCATESNGWCNYAISSPNITPP